MLNLRDVNHGQNSKEIVKLHIVITKGGGIKTGFPCDSKAYLSNINRHVLYIMIDIDCLPKHKNKAYLYHHLPAIYPIILFQLNKQ